MRNVAFTQRGFEEYNSWFENDPDMIERIKL